jgi:hypothetical protein
MREALTQMTERDSQSCDAFMAADLAWAFRDGADDSDSEWLLKTAAAIVESECTAHGLEDWELLQRRQEIDSPLVQRALDVLVAGGVLTTPTYEDHEHGGESG